VHGGTANYVAPAKPSRIVVVVAPTAGRQTMVASERGGEGVSGRVPVRPAVSARLSSPERRGAAYANRYISVLTIVERKVTRWRDYLDPIAVFEAVGWPPRGCM
jgi:ketosteroid isomerase-like protein